MSDQTPQRFDLRAEIERLQPGDSASGRRAETLVKNDLLRVVLVTMRAGAELAEHSAAAPITIQALEGRITVKHASGDDELDTGELIALEEGDRHSVAAQTDSAFLLTIGWSGGGARSESDPLS